MKGSNIIQLVQSAPAEDKRKKKAKLTTFGFTSQTELTEKIRRKQEHSGDCHFHFSSVVRYDVKYDLHAFINFRHLNL